MTVQSLLSTLMLTTESSCQQELLQVLRWVFCAVLCCAVLCRAVLCCAVLAVGILCCAVPCRALLGVLPVPDHGLKCLLLSSSSPYVFIS